jgi:hypothetical protein
MLYHLIKKKKKSLPASIVEIKKELKKKSKKSNQLPPLKPKEVQLLNDILSRTNSLNRNNVTRTKAYLDFYNQHPEIHWALLGHMVSRNGGYNMTDLKGEFLSRLMTYKERETFFSFLERGNWLIFQDAYPQFLVYEESLNHKENYFHLLPHLHVSTFMGKIWSYFWRTRDPSMLTKALIINEQSYLESRVMQDPYYKKEVFNTLEFKLQDLLAMNHILFPYQENGKRKLIGETLHHFESLHERILLGKRLYNILFEDPVRRKLVENWANKHSHTGSRKDYWPHLFNHVKEAIPDLQLKPRLNSCQLTSGSPRIYSPKLELTWKDQNHKKAEIGDWYKNWRIVYYLIDNEKLIDGEIEDEYCKTIERLELAAMAKKAISILD